MVNDPNQAPDANTRRARKEFSNLIEIGNEYMRSKPFTVWREWLGNPPHGEYAVISRRERDLPDDFGFDVVNVVSRLRAALDKAIFNIVVKNGRGPSGVSFPFGELEIQKRAKPFDTSVNPELVDTLVPKPISEIGRYKELRSKLTPDQWAVIEGFNAWPATIAGARSWAINEIANIDKHKGGLVQANVHVVSTTEVYNGYVDFIHPAPEGMDHLLSDPKKEKVELHCGPEAAKCLRYTPNINILFSQDIRGVGGHPVMDVLGHQIAWTERVINTLRAFF